MRIPKHYLHDKTIIALLSANTVLFLFAALFVLLRIDPAEGSTHIVQYRSNMGIGAFKSGSISELRLLALFAVVQIVCSTILSVRLYVHRRHLAIAVLALTTFILVVTPVVTDALLKVS
jgi:hypothetical protein